MCAAPGSKTAQLIEFLHADEDKMPTGKIIVTQAFARGFGLVCKDILRKRFFNPYPESCLSL